MPTISAVGKRSPTSTTTIESSYSRTIMFLPISPSPPSGRTRRVPGTRWPRGPRNRPSGPGRPEQPVALERAPDLRLLLLVGLDERQAQAADAVAGHVQRRLDRDRVRRDRHRLEDTAQRAVDPRALLGLVDHPPHLLADDVARDADPADAADVERAGEDVVVAGVEAEAVDRREGLVAGLLDVVDALDLGELREDVVRHVERRAGGDVVEDHRLVGGPRDLLEVAPEAPAVGLVVVRRDRQHRVGPDLGRARGHHARVVGVVGARARHDRRAVGALLDRELDEPQVLLVAQRRRLAGRAADDDAVGAVRAEVSHEVDERVLVDLQIVVERRDDRRQDRPQISHAADRIKPVRRLPCGIVPDLTVEVVAVRYAPDEGDFAVLAGVSDEGDEVVLTGALAHVHAGESVDVTGDWRTHPRHGAQFAVERVRVRQPESEAAVLAYLHSIKHVGIPAAAWLVERHGLDGVLDAIDRDPDRALREAPGIGPGRIRAAVRSWEDQRELRAVRLFLEGHGVPAGAAARIYRALGPGCVEMLQTDPYATTEVEGIGFATADALARALGTPLDAPSRIDAGLRHALREAENDGHCHLPRGELLERSRRMLGVDPADQLDELAARGKLVVEDDLVFDPVMHAIEPRPARAVAQLVDSPAALRRRRGDAFERPTAGDFVPTDDQWRAVMNAVEHRISILTGLPGTGKTQTMRALVDLMREQKRSVRLCAPTGKAAQRLGELTGPEARTIHRLLEYVPGEGFARGPDDPIPGLDLLIVDEASMLSVRLADALLGAVGPRTHVLLVGDVDQLAPVGPGRVLEDLIDSGVVPTVRLTEIFRQAARSLIVRAAHAINAGQPLPTTAGDGDIRDFFVIDRSAPAAIFEDVCDIAVRRLPAAYGLDPAREILVLSPMHKGPLGIAALNAELRRRLNADGAPIAGLPFRVGDRFVQRRNDHEHQLMNGETGVVVAGDDEDDERV